MSNATAKKNSSIVISALSARSSFGKLLQRIDTERRSLVIEKWGTPAAVLLNISDYVKLAAPEPEVLKLIVEEAERNRTRRARSTMSSRRRGQTRRSADAHSPTSHR